MQFNEYQSESRQYAAYPEAGDTFMYPALGLASEAGEVADKIKKLMRNEGVMRPSEVSPEAKAELTKELGDVLWYVSQLATELGASLDDIATTNLEKLASRKARHVIASTGDNR
jgi:NTP pyrophosphatase (non-canonical NTP hydrolase)